MTNEEKALSLSRKYATPKNKNREIAVYQSAIEMAEWKDQQFKEYGNFLLWIRDRLEYVYHENPNMDYMLKFQKIINDFLGEGAK